MPPVLLAGAILMVSLAVTLASAWQVRSLIQSQAQERFRHLEENLRHDLLRRLTTPRYGLMGARGMYAGSLEVTRQEMRDYVASRNLAQEFPGVLGIGVIKPVARAELSTFLEQERADDAPDFSITTTGDNPTCYVITSVFPQNRNRAAWGLDVGSEPLRRSAIEQAVVSGAPVLTRSITLIQDDERTPGFLMLVPIYRNGSSTDTVEERRLALEALVYAPIRALDLLRDFDQTGGGEAVAGVWQGDPASGGVLLHPQQGTLPTGARQVGVRTLTLFGIDLHLAVHSTPRLDASYGNREPLAILIAGTLISVLGSLYVLQLGRSRARVLKAAEVMTQDLRLAKAQAEHALREAEVYRATLEHHAIVSMTDRQGRITSVNDAFCAISGYRREELLGRDHRLINSGTHGATFWRQMWSTVLAGQSWRGVVCNRAKDGSLYWVDSMIAPFLDPDGAIDRLVSIRFDITAQKSYEARLHKLTALHQGILDSANVGIIATDPVGVVTLWNPAATRLLQWTPEEMVGVQTPAVIHVADEVVARAKELTQELGVSVAPGFDAFVAKARIQQVPDEREWNYVRKDGSLFSVLLSVTALRDGDGTVVGYLGIAADITERKRHDQELTAAKDAAQSGARAKADFLAVMSHEIRTPMNGVIGMTNLLVKTALDAQQREYAETIRSCGESLLTLINDILDFSKLEAGRVSLEQIAFPVQRVVEEVVALFASQAEDKGIALNHLMPADLPALVLGDPTRVRQVLLNLVSNAIKFTAHGSVDVRIASTRPSPQQEVDLTLSVQDSGVGMTPEQIARLGEAFTQADSSTTRRFGGTGLGMTISKALIGLMRGRLEVESRSGVGSVFHVHLRLPIAQAGALPLATTTVEDGHRDLVHLERILVVDDTKVNQRILIAMLRHTARSVEVADNGLEAIAAIARQRYDCVLMDCQMPEMDGYQATRAIRERERALNLPRLPVIALTAHALEGAREECMAAGMDDYLSKPIRENDLRGMLHRWFGNKSPATVVAKDPVASLRSSMDEADVRAVAQALVDEFPRLLHDLDDAHGVGDRSRIARIAHSFKGSGASLDLDGLHDVGRDLERQAKSAQPDTVRSLLDRLHGEVDRAVRYFQKFLGGGSS